MKEKLVTVKNQKIKIVGFKREHLRVIKVRLDSLALKDHKVYLKIDDNGICTECIDVTLWMPDEKNWKRYMYRPYKEELK